MIGNYLRGRLPAVVDGETNVVDVRDVAEGHLLAAARGAPGERYVLGGHDLRWVELIERVARLSGVHHPLLVLPPEAGALARRAEELGLASPMAGEGLLLMAQNWRYSSAKARRELGYRARRSTARCATRSRGTGADRERARSRRPPSPLSLAAAGVQLAGRGGPARRSAAGRALHRAAGSSWRA